MLFGLALLYATTQVAHVDDMFRVIPAVIDKPVVVLGLLPVPLVKGEGEAGEGEGGQQVQKEAFKNFQNRITI